MTSDGNTLYPKQFAKMEKLKASLNGQVQGISISQREWSGLSMVTVELKF